MTDLLEAPRLEQASQELAEQLPELPLAVRGQTGPQSRGRRWVLQARGGMGSDMRFLRLLRGGAAGTTRPTQAALQR